MRKMTNGRIAPQLFLFSLPLILGNFLQLSYDLFDFIILGQFAGKEKVIEETAALSVASPIFVIFTSLISGLCVGLAIHSSKLFGENNIKDLRKQFTTCLIVFGLVSIGLTLILNLLLNPIMILSNAGEVRVNAMMYLGITSLGFFFCFIYNLYSSFLRALGDSIASLIFLSLSCLLNIVLDIVFVIYAHMDIVGVALSTLIAQGIVAIAIIIYGKVRYKNILVFNIKEYKINKSLLKISSKYAIASALQQIVLYVGKYIVSIRINAFNDTVLKSSFGAVSKIDNFVFIPSQSFGHAASIFMAQNRGSKNTDRYKKGFITGMLFNVIYGIVISIIIAFTRTPLLNVFIDSSIKDKDLFVSYGNTYLFLMCFFYILPSFTNSIQSYFRGLGKLNIVFYSTTTQIIFRVSATYLFIYLLKDGMSSAAYGCLVGWSAMIIFESILLFKSYKQLNFSNGNDNS